jgi:hypothetical protein
MTNEQKMVKALLDYVETYAEENGLESADVMTALAHSYVIYGFSVRKEDVSYDTMRDAMIGFVTASTDHMVEAMNEKA